MAVVIVAFDGLIADTLGLRADAIAEAFLAESMSVDRAAIVRALPGRSLHEVVAMLAGDSDLTRNEIIALRGQRHYAERLSNGVLFAPHAREWIRAQRAACGHLVLRADSLRREISPLLALLDLESEFTLVRCADDAPRLPGSSTLEGSYAAIARRLDTLRISTDRVALEFGNNGAKSAQPFVRRYIRAERLPYEIVVTE